MTYSGLTVEIEHCKKLINITQETNISQNYQKHSITGTIKGSNSKVSKIMN